LRCWPCTSSSRSIVSTSRRAGQHDDRPRAGVGLARELFDVRAGVDRHLEVDRVRQEQDLPHAGRLAGEDRDAARALGLQSSGEEVLDAIAIGAKPDNLVVIEIAGQLVDAAVELVDQRSHLALARGRRGEPRRIEIEVQRDHPAGGDLDLREGSEAVRGLLLKRHGVKGARAQARHAHVRRRPANGFSHGLCRPDLGWAPGDGSQNRESGS
jgi:hypothetical protein